MDVFTKEKRSEVMSKIRSSGTWPEREAARLMRGGGIRYRSHPRLHGSPDFIVEGRLVLFCDGSFWHGRDWPGLRARLAAGNNPEYWLRHIGGNRRRDRRVNARLRKDGYLILRLWDSDIRKRPEWCVRAIRAALDGGRQGARCRPRGRGDGRAGKPAARAGSPGAPASRPRAPDPAPRGRAAPQGRA